MIEVKNLTKHYGDKVALEDVSFSVKNGEILGLLGLNGAGKTTTMNIMTGYIGATKGTVTVDGYDMMENPIEAKGVIGYLPEQPPLYLDMRVSEYLEFVYNLKRGTKENRKQQIDQISEKVGIADVHNRIMKNLSKGYRQRVGLAQALIGSPKVLILDEPTVGLDPSQIIEIRTLIKELGKTKTVIVSSHILPEVKAICNRVVVLHQGRKVADDTSDNLSKIVYEPHRVTAWIQGEMESVQEAFDRSATGFYIEQLEQKEPGVYEYLIEGKEGEDIRVNVFRVLARADLPMFSPCGHEFSLEDVFLRLISTNSQTGGEA